MFSRLTKPDPVKPATNIYPRSDTEDRPSTGLVLFPRGFTENACSAEVGLAKGRQALSRYRCEIGARPRR